MDSTALFVFYRQCCLIYGHRALWMIKEYLGRLSTVQRYEYLNSTDYGGQGWTLLHFACVFGDLPLVCVLSWLGADASIQYGAGCTALMLLGTRVLSAPCCLTANIHQKPIGSMVVHCFTVHVLDAASV